jgi:hypothetical protein
MEGGLPCLFEQGWPLDPTDKRAEANLELKIY